ncbi:MAG: hypothetical protein JWO94_364 [Verrucomicrobiaceae bacterium]|nr:hypothetical protein [Verrucomicrobiaceae bacterium]
MRSLLITLEQKLGRFAIPGLLRIIITLQVVVWLLLQLGSGGSDLVWNLCFVPPAITANHEWWRLISFLVIPTGSGLLWVLMGVPFMWMVSDGLEEAWGSFRVNLYLLACVVCVDATGFIFDMPVASSFTILASTVMAFAVYYPDHPINLYGIIPLKMMWIGLMDFGFLVFNALGNPSMRLHTVASLIPFLVVFGPCLSQLLHRKATTLQRRQRFASSKMGEGESLHRCSRCGKTDQDNPRLDFRVNAEGEDVCSDCRAAAMQGT